MAEVVINANPLVSSIDHTSEGTTVYFPLSSIPAGAIVTEVRYWFYYSSPSSSLWWIRANGVDMPSTGTPYYRVAYLTTSFNNTIAGDYTKTYGVQTQISLRDEGGYMPIDTGPRLTVIYTPPTPTKPTVTNVTFNNAYTTVGVNRTLSWTGTNGNYNAITSYDIYRSVNGAAYAFLVNQTGTSLSVAPAAVGQHHRYYIIAKAPASNSDAAYSPYLYTYSDPSVSGVTLDAAYVKTGTNTVLRWAAADGSYNAISKYLVYRSINDAAYALLGETTNKYLTVAGPGTVGHKHRYYIVAVGALSNSAAAYSPYLYTFTDPAVSGVTLSGGYAAANANVTLSWTGTAGTNNSITKYAVYRSINGAAYALLGETTSGSMTVAAPATAGQYHRYYVVAIGQRSNSAAVYSGYLYAYSNPGAPTGVAVSPTTAFTGATVRVSWTAGAAGTGVSISKYEVYRDGVLVGSTTALYLDTAAPGAAGTATYTVKSIGSVAGYNSGLSSGAALTVQYPASTGSLNKTTVPLDGVSTITLTITPASSAFTHKAVWYIGSASTTQDVAAGGTSNVFTVPLAWNNQVTGATSGTGYVRLETYSGATKTGEKVYSFTVTVPATIVPTLSAATATRVQNGVDATITNYVQNYSKVTIAASGAAGAYGSTIASYLITGEGFSSAAGSATFGPLTKAGTNTFTVLITDSRGRTASKTVSVTVQAYTKPSLSGVSAYRCSSTGTQMSNGTYARLFANTVFSSIGGQNTATLQGRVYMKGAAAPAYTAMTTGVAWIAGAGGILVNKTYVVDLIVTDKLNNYSVSVEIPTEVVGLNILDGATGAAIGKYAEAPDEFQLPESWRLRGNLQVKDVRGTNPTPDAMPDKAVSTFFNDQYGHTWMSGFTVKGWGTSYQAWQLAAPSSSADNERLLFRVGRGAAWGGWREILTSNNWTSYITLAALGAAASSHSHSYLSDSGDTLTGLLQISGQKTINTTTPGLTNYGLHFTGQTTADYATGITWNGGTGSVGAQAGIYVQGSGAYGTKMFFATTNSYAIGAQTAISIDQTGVVNFVRSRPTALGNLILDAGNYTSYAPTKTGTGASGTWGISVTGSSASCTGNAATATTASACSGNAATATTASDSSKLGGLSLGNATQGSHPGANAVVRTDANGYINCGWINTVSGTATGTPTRIYCSQDAYLRYYAPSDATLRRSMGAYITSGTAAPSGGSSGDIYIKY